MQASITVKNCSVTKGGVWNALEGLVSAVDSEGNTVPVTDIKVKGSVLIQLPGDYPIIYSFYDKALQGEVRATMTVTVLDKKSLSPKANLSLKEK